MTDTSREDELVAWAAELGAADRPVRRRATTATAPSSPRPSTCCARRATWPSPCRRSSAGAGATIREVAMAQRRLAQVVRVDRAGLGDAPARHPVHGVAVPPRPAGCRGDAAAHRRRAASCSSRRAAPTSPRPRGTAVAVDGGFRVIGPQGLRQPGPGRRRVLDDVRARRRRHAGRPEHGRAGPRRRRHRARQLGHARHARHREPRRRHRRRLRARGARARPAPLRRRRPAAAGHRQHRHAGDRRPSTSASPRRPATPPSPPSPARRAPTTRRSSARSGRWTTACG